VQKAFDTVRRAIQSAFDALKPGVECWTIDAIARKVVVDAGYPEYQHATGHTVGRAAHDGGGVLGPKWERYGKTPTYLVEAGNVFTLGRVLPEFLNVDYKGVRSLSIPVFMFMGRHDYTTPAQPTADWLAKVSAPAKQGVWFERSSHMIPWEEPGKMLMSLVQDVRPFAEPGAEGR
jgi:pimeloyl-ACP methyl ester carboxylesterase